MKYARDLMDQILGAIEQRELRSLQWGYVDGTLGEDEIHSLVCGVLGPDRGGIDPEDVVEELLQLGMVFERPHADGSYRYRSRFAEGVRLLSMLKQLFPDRPWVSSSGLVSDYRVDARPRAFPRRDIPATDALAALAQAPRWSNRHSELAQDLLPPEFRLAAFQVRAMQKIMQNGQGDCGIVVCAGTGSGKTLSFYMPTIVEIGTLVQHNEHWVKAVALYPRIELLKDQFGEAYRSARRVDGLLQRRGQRPIRLGTLFSLTPYDCDVRALETASWSASGGGFVCPFLSCPECGEDLIWHRHDIERGVERLVCRKAPRCSGTVTADQVVLTRRELVSRPPDIVFTTTETLNQRLSDTATRQVLGVTRHPDRKLRLVLLDEVHTYSGPTGAQTALVLRRWRHALGTPTRFVGLSATLREAPQFFADLVGLDAEDVVEVTPTEDELDHKSMIYQLVLRGNPASQTQLLSTSIQVSFLLARILDPLPVSPLQASRSGGFYGSRLFVFTDDLDVTNRLFDNLRDAEAHDIFGRPDPRREPLSALRSSARPDVATRDRAGQNWRTVEEIGHPLEQRLRITRTSSQDQGVSQTSDVIVATAALEVGFNDPTVGAVLQHKSPHDMAAYLQRKGRAGRTQTMRPWMVTVLSEYGRDRLTYQAYDQLFDPVLVPQRLPVKNRHILRMQSVLAFLDWLAETLQTSGLRGWMWRVLNGPAEEGSLTAKQQEALLQRLEALFSNDGSSLQQLTNHLSGALQLDSEDEVWSILWEPPRALMLEVIPTLIRRLQTKWRAHPSLGEATLTDMMAAGGRVHPLPDFLPSTLFNPLNVPDVTVRIPPAARGREERTEPMGIVQALRQIVPGRITRRFAFERGSLYHWVPVPIEGGEYRLPVSRYAEQHEFVTTVPVEIKGEVKGIPIFRPWTVRLERVSEREVSPTSNAVLSWRYQVDAPGDPTTVSSSRDPRWGSVVADTAFFLHNFRTPLTIRRFALEATATLRRPGVAQDVNVHTCFTTEDDQPAAVGFEQAVDGLRIRVQLPNLETLTGRATRSPNAPAWRSAYLRERVMNDEALANEANWFQRDWLQQIFLSALLAKAAQAQVPLEEACAQFRQSDPSPAFAEVMDSVFRIDPLAEDDEAELDDTEAAGNRRVTLRERLTDLLSRPAVLERLQTLATVLWDPNMKDWSAWLADRIAETMAEAALQACQRIAPRYVSPDSLLVDVASQPETAADGNTFEIWITEANLGGAGAMEAIAEEVIGSPRKLFAALDASLAPGDLEVVASGLDSFVHLTQGNPEVAAAIDVLRQQEKHVEHQAQFRALVALLARKGLTVDPSLGVALHQRLLRQGTSAESDRLVHDLLGYWKELQQRFEIAIDLRVFCYLAVVQPAFAQRLQGLLTENTGVTLSTGECVSTLAGVLWAQPLEQRSRTLQSHNPFHSPRWTDPSLVRDLLLSGQVENVDFADADWRDRLHAALADAGTVRLTCSREHEPALHRALYPLLADPINVDYLQFFLAIERMHRDERTTTVTFAIKEIV